MKTGGLFALLSWIVLSASALSHEFVLDGSSPVAINESVTQLRGNLTPDQRDTFERGLERMMRLRMIDNLSADAHPDEYSQKMLVFETNTLMQRLQSMHDDLHGVGLNRILALGRLASNKPALCSLGPLECPSSGNLGQLAAYNKRSSGSSI